MSNPFDPELIAAARAAEEMLRLTRLTSNFQIATIPKDFDRTAALYRSLDLSTVRAYVGALSAFERSLPGVARLSEQASAVHDMAQQLAAYNERFVTPIQDQIAQIRRLVTDSQSWKLFDLQSSAAAAIHDSVAKMTSQWVDSQDALKSFLAVSELHTLAAGLAALTPFSSAVTDALRLDFGDWRTVTTIPDAVLIDPVARFDFYRDLGFDDALTDFPAPAFAELLHRSGLRPSSWPAPATHYREGLQITPDNEDDKIPDGNRDAYDVIFRLETILRQFIDEEMTIAFGEEWAKHQLPAGMHQEWQGKQSSAEKAGQPKAPLIAYADFSHYQKIIERRDNWDRVFKAIFGRKEDIQESLIRLAPVRICTMHCRVITPDDHLLLLAEARRVLSALKNRKAP